MSKFGHLHTHSEFSLLDGEQQIKKMIDKAKAMGQDFIAITDHGTMYGLVKANKYAKEVGIKHIVGCELYTTPWGRDMKDRDYAKGEKSNGHLIVLAKNKVGYKNLCRLCSIAYRDGYYYKPRVDHKTSTPSITVPFLNVATSAENLLSPLVDTSYPLSENLPHFISSSSGSASLILEKNVSKA